MERRRTPFSMTLAFADPHARGGHVAEPRTTARERSGATPTALAVSALLWLLLGCSGLLWVIAFTRDADSLVLALAVWGLGFVGPSLCATSVAYRLEDDASQDNAAPARTLGRH